VLQIEAFGWLLSFWGQKLKLEAKPNRAIIQLLTFTGDLIKLMTFKCWCIVVKKMLVYFSINLVGIIEVLEN
jgi:hypothetical protein